MKKKDIVKALKRHRKNTFSDGSDEKGFVCSKCKEKGNKNIKLYDRH